LNFDGDIAGIAGAAPHIFAQATPQKIAHSRWSGRRKCIPVRFTFQHGGDHVAPRLASKRAALSEQFKQDATQSPNVSTLVYSVSARLFGAHVARRTDDRAGPGHGFREGLVP